jgi:hypothetical protein
MDARFTCVFAPEGQLMFRRLLPAMLIAASVALVAVGSVALARGMADDDGENELLDRVAAELGIDPQTLKDAVTQAEREQIKAKQDEFLAALVEKGIITQEEADSASAWLDSRPAAADRLVGKGLIFPFLIIKELPLRPEFPRGGHGLFGQDEELLNRVAEILGIEPETLREALTDAGDGLQAERRVEAINAAVDSLVEEGVLTEAEGAEVKAWVGEMPQWLKESDLLGRLIGAAGPHPLRSDLPLLIEPGEGWFRLPGDARQAPAHPFIVPEPFEFPKDGEHFRFRFHGPDGEFHFDLPDLFKAPDSQEPDAEATPQTGGETSHQNA